VTHTPSEAQTFARRDWRAFASENVALSLILAAAAALHWNVLRAPFFADDFLFLDQVRDRSLIGALLSPDPIGNFMRPLSRQVYFWCLSRVGGEQPVVFHAAGLLLFLGSIVLLYSISKRLIGALGAAVAAAIFALHYSADVPLLWASGAQDLFALLLSLAAIELYARGRAAWAVLACFLALLCKETAIVTPVLAMLADPRPAETRGARLRRAIPFGIAIAAWAALWMIVRSFHGGGAQAMRPDASSVLAALAHLIQVTFGLERGVAAWWTQMPPLPIVALVLAAVAVIAVAWNSPKRSRSATQNRAPETKRAAASRARQAQKKNASVAPSVSAEARRSRRGSMRAFSTPLARGLTWAIVAALPIAVVANIWSAYYYLLAIGGMSLAIGALCARAPRAIAVAVVIAFGTLSAGARSLDEFATVPGAWTTLSHVNGLYIERSAALVSKLLGQLRAAKPTLPSRATIFFGGVPSSSGWQTTDGPLLRWAYRDSSLRSYFMTQFTRERATRGPAFFFSVEQGTMKEMWKGGGWPEGLAMTLMLDEKPQPARDALSVVFDAPYPRRADQYLMAWLELAIHDTSACHAHLVAAGCRLGGGPTPEIEAALASVRAGGDTLAAQQHLVQALVGHVLDPELHGALADLLLMKGTDTQGGYIEANAAKLLSPDDAYAWRRWSQVLVQAMRYRQALAALNRYFALAGDQGRNDAEAVRWREELERMQPGGDLVQRSLGDFRQTAK
jgi:hypothetical protein